MANFMNDHARLRRCQKHHQKQQCSDQEASLEWTDEAAKCLYQIWKLHTAGYVTIATLDRKSNTWKEYWFDAGVGEQKVKRCLAKIEPAVVDLYYCPNSFKARRRKAQLGHNTPYAWADCDAYHPAGYEPEPGVIVETSKGSYQALWLFDTAVKASVAEAYSKKFVYDFGGDKGGHSVTKLLRVPATRNNKPERNGDLVKLLKFDLSPIPRSKVWMREISASLPRGNWNRRAIGTTSLSAQRIITKYRRYVPPSILLLLTNKAMSPDWPDRSKAIYLIVTAFHDARAKPAEIVTVLVSNPYFVSKHGTDAENAWDEVNRIFPKLGR